MSIPVWMSIGAKCIYYHVYGKTDYWAEIKEFTAGGRIRIQYLFDGEPEEWLKATVSASAIREDDGSFRAYEAGRDARASRVETDTHRLIQKHARHTSKSKK